MKSFEKNIKTQANAFQMDPTPGSFDKVIAALEKKKKRRFIFWLWFLIPGFAIGGTIGIYQIFSSSDKTTLAHQKTEYVTESTKNSDEQTTSQSSSTENIISSSSAPDNSNIHSSEKNTEVTNESQTDVTNKNESNTFEKKKNNSTVNTNTKNIHQTHIIDANQLNIKNNDDKSVTDIGIKKRINESAIRPFFPTSVKIQENRNGSLLSTKDIPLEPSILPIPTTLHSKFSLGVYSDLGVSKSIFTSKQNDSTSQGYYSARKETDQFIFSYSAGLQFRYSPVKFLTVETGIGFTHYESNQIIVNGGASSSSMTTDLLDTVITLFASAPTSKEYRNTYDYISIPLKVYYQKRWKWTSIEAGGGVIFDIPVHTEAYVADENSGYSYLRNTVKDSRLNMFGIQVSANVNMVFHVKKFSLFVGPTFKYRLNSMFDENYIIQQRPYFIGGQLGVRYNF